MSAGGPNEEWWTGPAGARRSYRVTEPVPLPGGQGYVFRAVAPDGADVVLKVAESATADDEAKLRQRLAALVEHPHPRIRAKMRVFRGPGLFRGDPPPEDECDLLVSVSPWIEGRTLRAAGAMPPAAALQVIADVAEAVDHLHEACGFVHRDLHPGNVIVGPDGRATLIDLGAAREDDGGRTTTVAGVLGFIAPERTHGPGDRRTDRWGVGMIAVFALLGHPQGERSADELRADLRRALQGTARPARGAALVAAMVDPDPAARPANLRTWVRDLRAAMATTAARSRRRTLVVVGVVLVVAAAAAVAMAWALDGDDDEAADAPAATTTTLACTAELGEPGDAVDPRAVAAVAPLFASVADGSCATGPVEGHFEALVQPVAGTDGPGVVVVGSDRVAVRLSEAQWRSYLGLGETIAFAGLPVAASVEEATGAFVVELANSGYLVGRRADSYHGWIPEQAYSVWVGIGGADGPLGYPMTGPYFFHGGIRHDFEGGYFEVAAENYPYNALDPDVIEVHEVSDSRRRDEIEAVGDVEGRIVRQDHGPDWYVDEDRRRRWIPDGAVLECLLADVEVAAEDVPGWAVSMLRLGPPATCG